jgi:hypothetical protein
MTITDTLEQVRLICRMRRLSYHTATCYAGWITRFARHIRQNPQQTREERVRSYLEKLAPRTSASTQNQTPNVIPFARAHGYYWYREPEDDPVIVYYDTEMEWIVFCGDERPRGGDMDHPITGHFWPVPLTPPTS